MVDPSLNVGIADMKMAQHSGTLITYALGSCIGICLYDPLIHLAALVHIMLPLNMETGRTNTFKYADTGIRETVKLMTARGAKTMRMEAKIAGGAKMFDMGNGILGSIGQRNIESTRLVLKREGIRLVGENVGGNVARTLSLDATTGKAMIHSYGSPDYTF